MTIDDILKADLALYEIEKSLPPLDPVREKISIARLAIMQAAVLARVQAEERGTVIGSFLSYEYRPVL